MAVLDAHGRFLLAEAGHRQKVWGEVEARNLQETADTADAVLLLSVLGRYLGALIDRGAILAIRSAESNPPRQHNHTTTNCNRTSFAPGKAFLR